MVQKNSRHRLESERGESEEAVVGWRGDVHLLLKEKQNLLLVMVGYMLKNYYQIANILKFRFSLMDMEISFI